MTVATNKSGLVVHSEAPEQKALRFHHDYCVEKLTQKLTAHTKLPESIPRQLFAISQRFAAVTVSDHWIGIFVAYNEADATRIQRTFVTAGVLDQAISLMTYAPVDCDAVLEKFARLSQAFIGREPIRTVWPTEKNYMEDLKPIFFTVLKGAKAPHLVGLLAIPPPRRALAG